MTWRGRKKEQRREEEEKKGRTKKEGKEQNKEKRNLIYSSIDAHVSTYVRANNHKLCSNYE